MLDRNEAVDVLAQELASQRNWHMEHDRDELQIHAAQCGVAVALGMR
jgi:hypothetical protein